MKKTQPILLLALLLPLTAGAAEVFLRAEEFSLTLPNGGATPTVVPMWGYRLCYDGFSNCVNPDTNALNPVQSPGPEIRVPADDPVLNIHLQNRLPVSTSLIIPGQPAALAPVASPDADARLRIRAFTAEIPAADGDTYGDRIYSWTGLNSTGLRAGAYLYQSGSHVQLQVHMGLFGALVHDAPCAVGACAYPAVPYDTSRVLVFSEIDPALHETRSPVNANNYAPRFFLVNGQTYPNASQPALTAAPGSWMLLRLLNAGIENHAPQLLGGHFSVIAEDGNPLDPSIRREQHTVLLPAAKSLDLMFSPGSAGTYPLFDRRLRLTNDIATGGGMQVRIAAEGAPLVRPQATADSFTTGEDAALTIAAPGVLANDSDPAAQPLQAVFATNPSKGTVTVAANGGFVYTPNANANGADSFTYRASNGAALSNPATVNLSVTPANDAPVAVDDFFYPTVNSGAFDIAAPGILVNDTDVDTGDSLTAVNFGAILGAGTASITGLDANGSFTFTAPQSGATPYAGRATFTYAARDAGGLTSGNATANVVKDLAVAVQLTGTAAQRSPVYRNLPGTANDRWQVRGAIRALPAAVTLRFRLGADESGAEIGSLLVPAGATTFAFTQNAGPPPQGTNSITLLVDVPAAGGVPAHQARILNLPFARQNN